LRGGREGEREGGREEGREGGREGGIEGKRGRGDGGKRGRKDIHFVNICHYNIPKNDVHNDSCNG